MRILAFATVALLFAGCIGTPPEAPAETVTPAGVVIDADRPDTAFNDVVTGPAVGPDLNATLDAPPRLVAGEWWRVRFEGGIAGDQVDVIRVVAEVRPDGYVMGMPHEGWYKEVISYHSPGLGDVGFDLSYSMHNERFEPVRFPLEQGATWDTVFATAPYTATVESVEGTKATIVLTSAAEPSPTDPVFALFGFAATPMTLVYDASVHEIVRFESPIGLYEIVEHGYDFAGWVTVPRGEHTAIDYGQLGPLTPGEPVIQRAIEVEGGFNRMTLMQAIFPLAPGAYRIRTVAPDGTEFMVESMGEPTIRFVEVANPDGTWQAEDLVAGVGGTYSMGIAYHQYDIHLPDGAKRSDHSHEVIR